MKKYIISRQKIVNSVKRKTAEDISYRASKLLQTNDGDVEILSTGDPELISKLLEEDTLVSSCYDQFFAIARYNFLRGTELTRGNISKRTQLTDATSCFVFCIRFYHIPFHRCLRVMCTIFSVMVHAPQWRWFDIVS